MLSVSVVQASPEIESSAPELLGVLEFNNPTPRYIHQSFSNYFHYGDRIDFNGYIMQVGDWDRLLDATANVKVQGPDGSIVFEKNLPTKNNEFDLSLQITPDFKVGKYLASVEPVQDGYKLVDNQYLTPFYVFRNNTHTIMTSEGTYSVIVGSFEFESSNVKFDEAAKKLSFDVHRIDGKYAADGDTAYPGHFMFVLIERPLLTGSLQYDVGDGISYWPSVQTNNKWHSMQVGADNFYDKVTIVVWGNQ